jgi:hypothetical protein
MSAGITAELVNRIAGTYPGTKPDNIIGALKVAPGQKLPFLELRKQLPGGTSCLMQCNSLEEQGFVTVTPHGPCKLEDVVITLVDPRYRWLALLRLWARNPILWLKHFFSWVGYCISDENIFRLLSRR